MSVFEWVNEQEVESALSELSINNTQWYISTKLIPSSSL
jgi:hypothetical protein